MIRFILPGLPPSINHSHYSWKRRLKPKTKKWIDQAHFVLSAQSKGTKFGKDYPIGMEIRMYGEWFTKAGAFKRSDLSNRIKLLEDVVAEVLGFDDSRVVELSARKIGSNHIRTEVDVWDVNALP